MLNRYRLALVAGILGLTLSGLSVTTVNAEEKETPEAACKSQADENGLEGNDRAEFIQDCIKSMQEEAGK